MKKLIPLLLLGVLLGSSSSAQILRAFTPRYSNTSVRGNIVYVSNNIITSSGGNTTEAAPGGSSTNNGRTGVNVDVDASSSTNFIPVGSSWKYLDNNTRPAGWETGGFDDLSWASGNAELGYGDGDEATVVSFGGVSTSKFITTLFRRTVNIPDPTIFTSFRFDIEYDDGYVLYVNGVEVGRGNMPTGAVTNATLASSAIEDQTVTVTIPTSAFVAGSNTIAVEIHQSGASSSDLSFNGKLDGVVDATFNSSTANLGLSSCSQVLWAGLYWGASQGTNGANTSWITGENTVLLKVPGAASYTSVTASQVDYHNSALVPALPHSGYRSFADITALINSTSPNGTYTVANVTSPAGFTNTSGGWTIVIVYANPSEVPRNLTVFDGSAIVDGGAAPLDVNISGFLTPPSGPVSCELGGVVFDGDRASLDSFSFRQSGASSFTNLTPNTLSSLNDMWNSTISYKGVNVSTRNPAHANTNGYDADIILLPNSSNSVLGNNMTSATVRFGSPSENYFVQVLTTAISVYNPSIQMVKTATDVNGGSLLPGDVLRYEMTYTNVGTDASAQTVITDRIPSNATYKPGTLQIAGVPKTDAAGDDEAEFDVANNRVVFRVGSGANASAGGGLASSGSGSVSFDVFTPTSCVILACNNTLSNSARIDYMGSTSLQPLSDSSGYMVSGCFTKGPVTATVSGSCAARNDTSLVNVCPSTAVSIPVSVYGGFSFYTGMPFGPATAYDPATPVTATRTIYAFYDGTGTCDDTVLIRVYVNPCPDIDDDDDGIPDYVEAGNPAAFGDHDSDGVPNYGDVHYPGFVDHNSDGIHDLFDPGADHDNDGVPNFLDTHFPGFTDSNGDGVNDAFDADGDAVPNHLDIDSDNDGIPDVVESYGVDANGDGRIDGYSDTDADGFSQNVDANASGIAGSGNGLTAIDTDGDGVPNYLDADSDNDGIPDVVEVYGADTNNDGRIDGFTDFDGDGLSDNVDGDSGNDGTVENPGITRLRTGADGNGDGRADSYSIANIDADGRPNPYDLDADGDGIADVVEAQFPDTDYDGRVDGALTARGWSTTISALSGLTLSNRDGTGRADVYDIDSDDDGIPDNVEGQPTLLYQLPLYTDSDGDGIDDSYDDLSGFGGKGISVYNRDGDAWPDYLDLDTDGDGLIDRVEGNDLNFNQQPDDNVTLTGMDTDGDGLDDRFDNNNSSARGTSAYMGNGGALSGDPTPGSSTVVQRSHPSWSDRDWRMVEYVLPVEFLTFSGQLTPAATRLRWSVICEESLTRFEVEKSRDGSAFTTAKSVTPHGVLQVADHYESQDVLPQGLVWYRIKATTVSGKIRYSRIVQLSNGKGLQVIVAPNPVRDRLTLQVQSEDRSMVSVRVVDLQGRILIQQAFSAQVGTNAFSLSANASWAAGSYVVEVTKGEQTLRTQILIQR